MCFLFLDFSGLSLNNDRPKDEYSGSGLTSSSTSNASPSGIEINNSSTITLQHRPQYSQVGGTFNLSLAECGLVC